MAGKTKKGAQKSTLDIASELLEVRQLKNKYTLIDKALTTELKTRLKDGDDSQDYFEITTARAIEITDQSKAVAWAQEKYPHILTVDTKAAKTILQRELTPLPEGFEVKETERLTQVGNNNEE